MSGRQVFGISPPVAVIHCRSAETGRCAYPAGRPGLESVQVLFAMNFRLESCATHEQSTVLEGEVVAGGQDGDTASQLG